MHVAISAVSWARNLSLCSGPSTTFPPVIFSYDACSFWICSTMRRCCSGSLVVFRVFRSEAIAASMSSALATCVDFFTADLLDTLLISWSLALALSRRFCVWLAHSSLGARCPHAPRPHARPCATDTT